MGFLNRLKSFLYGKPNRQQKGNFPRIGVKKENVENPADRHARLTEEAYQRQINGGQ
jgi:hypothetical protein